GTVVGQEATTIHPSSLRNFLFFNSGIQGCSIIINAEVVHLLRPFPSVLAMHDHLLTLGTITSGRVIYLDKVLMWYRQHGKYVSDAEHEGIVARLLTDSRRGKPVVDRSHILPNRAFYEHYFGKLAPADRSILE